MRQFLNSILDRIAEIGGKMAEVLEKYLLGEDHIVEPTGNVHFVKCDMKPFKDVEDGLKLFELRKNDRDYRQGEDLVLREYDSEEKQITGREIETQIIYIMENYQGIEPGYCILGIEPY